MNFYDIAWQYKHTLKHLTLWSSSVTKKFVRFNTISWYCYQFY